MQRHQESHCMWKLTRGQCNLSLAGAPLTLWFTEKIRFYGYENWFEGMTLANLKTFFAKFRSGFSASLFLKFVFLSLIIKFFHKYTNLFFFRRYIKHIFRTRTADFPADIMCAVWYAHVFRDAVEEVGAFFVGGSSRGGRGESSGP